MPGALPEIAISEAAVVWARGVPPPAARSQQRRRDTGIGRATASEPPASAPSQGRPPRERERAMLPLLLLCLGMLYMSTSWTTALGVVVGMVVLFALNLITRQDRERDCRPGGLENRPAEPMPHLHV